jgi:DNA topoisomerase-2
MLVGTGWSTFIPTFHPMDIIQHVQYRLGKNSSHSTLKPWIRGFDGSIINHTDMIYKTMGVYHHKEKNIIEVRHCMIIIMND